MNFTTKSYLVTPNHKPYAKRRAIKSGGRITYILRARAASLAGDTLGAAMYTRWSKRGNDRATILRPGTFFYCQYCGKRMTADETVYSNTSKCTQEPEEILCRTCADTRGYEVFDSEKRSRSVNFSDDYHNGNYIQ
jgi:hypothetical protein